MQEKKFLIILLPLENTHLIKLRENKQHLKQLRVEQFNLLFFKNYHTELSG